MLMIAYYFVLVFGFVIEEILHCRYELLLLSIDEQIDEVDEEKHHP